MKIRGEDSCLEKCAKRIGLSNRGCYLLITGAAVMTFAILLIVITVTSSQTGIVRRFALFYSRIPPPSLMITLIQGGINAQLLVQKSVQKLE